MSKLLSISEQQDKDEDIAMFMQAPIDIEFEEPKYTEPLPQPEPLSPLSPASPNLENDSNNDNSRTTLKLSSGGRIINDIIGKFLTFFDSPLIFWVFQILDKSFHFYVNSYNPKCAKNIVFKLIHEPKNICSYVSQLEITRNIIDLDFSKFPNLSKITGNSRVLTIRNYKDVMRKIKEISLIYSISQIVMDHVEFIAILKSLDFKKHEELLAYLDEKKEVGIEERTKRRNDVKKRQKYEVWKSCKTLRTLKFEYYPVLDVPTVLTSILGGQSPPFLCGLDCPPYPFPSQGRTDGKFREENPIPQISKDFLKRVEFLVLRNVNLSNRQFVHISKTIKKLHLYECNASLFPQNADPNDEYFQDEDDDAIGDLNFCLSQCINLEDLLIRQTGENIRFLDSSLQDLKKLKKLALDIPSGNFTGSSLPSSASSLEFVKISSLPKFNGMIAFRSMFKLQYLHLDFPKIHHDLEAQNSSIGDLDGLDLISLKKIKLMNCLITDHSLSKMKKLNSIYLSNCTRVVGSGFQYCSKNLRKLRIIRGGGKISDQIFPYLVNCRKIFLSYCPNIGRKFYSHTQKQLQVLKKSVGGLIYLEELELDNMSSFVGDFFLFTPNIRRLEIKFCPKLEMKEEFFSGMRRLTHLVVVKSKLNFDVLKTMQGLETLILKPWTNHYLFRTLKKELKNIKKFSVEY